MRTLKMLTCRLCWRAVGAAVLAVDLEAILEVGEAVIDMIRAEEKKQ